MRKIFISLFFIFCSYFSFSSHFMGGEITWKCMKGGPNIGQYVFEMKVYRDCSGITFSQTSQTVTHHNYPTLGQSTPILMNFISVNDISPTGAASSGNSCFDCAAGDEGAVEEYIWRSDPMTLGGTPPVEGWHFTWGSSARSSLITNGMANDPWTLRAVMYPYDSDPSAAVSYLAADPCYDSSPEFKELAKTIICTGYPFAYSHNASDEELDEISYDWAEPLGTSGAYDPLNPSATALIFAPSPPYSVTYPIPGSPTLDSQTGEITYDSDTAGIFVTCVKVEARKCNQLVAEIYREVQVMLLNCAIYNPPSDGFNDPPTISAPFVGTPTPYETIVYAGQLISFNVQAEDLDTYPGSVAQDITLDASGGQFSTDFTNPNLCANPPCATFNNGTGVIPPFSAPTIVNGFFEWQTACAHMTADVGCNTTSNVFTFLIKAFDDFCPANGISIATIKITVVPPIPDLRCTEVLENGDVILTWKYADGAPPIAEPYMVWNSNNPNGPFTLIDSIFHPTTKFTHNSAGGNVASQYYYLSTEASCGVTAGDLHSDTLQSIFMNVIPMNLGVSANLDWNAIHDPLPYTSSTDYELFLKNPNTNFTNILTTPNLNYIHNTEFCDYFPEFYVEIDDASGCSSKSNVGVTNLLDTVTPVTPIITDVSVDINGKAVISWLSSPGADKYAIYFLDNTGIWITIDTVLVPATTYTFPFSTAMDNYETFQVLALDSCGNHVNASIEHNSINLKKDLNECSHTIQLDWNEYINWSNGLSHYQVFVEETDLSGGLNISQFRVENQLAYLIQNIIHDYTYNIYVYAYNSDSTFSAKSNAYHFVANLPKMPDFNYIEYASINHDNGYVEINCKVDEIAIIDNYRVYRSLRDDSVFQPIGSFPFNHTSSVHYTDKTANTDEYFYQYQVHPIDTCGHVVATGSFFDAVTGTTNDTSSYAQTILLHTEINLDYSDSVFTEEYTNTLDFNEYEKWLGNVSEYRLYRSINREPFNLLPLYIWDRLINPDEPLLYIDIVTEFGAGNGRFCYYIEAIEGVSTPYGPVVEGSFSNISCVSQTPILFVPNTFSPNGDEHNEVFLPISFFVSEIGYSFVIYNRSGMEMFSTNDPAKGWDGTYMGNIVQSGNYIYHVQYINGVGDLTEKTDIITLVR